MCKRKGLTDFLLAVLAVTALLSCSNDEFKHEGAEEPEEYVNPVNYWYRAGMVSAGIRSIGDIADTVFYDQDGRRILSKNARHEWVYTYNSDGLPVSVVEQMHDAVGNPITIATDTYEYANEGRFIPMTGFFGYLCDVFENGLYPGLSKWTHTDEFAQEVTQYSFQGDTLTIHFTSDNPQESYNDILVRYEGAYPVSACSDYDTLGLLSYQENGMFDTFVDGCYDNGELYKLRTVTVNRKFGNRMLKDREVIQYFNGEFSRTETTVYTYNGRGDCILEESTNSLWEEQNSRLEQSYIYDSKWNWTKQNNIRIFDSNTTNPVSFVTEREIKYY